MNQSGNHSKRRLWTIIEIIILIVIAVVIIRHLPRILAHLQQIDVIDVVVAAVVLSIGYVLFPIRWQHLLSHKPGFLVTFQTAYVGQMINMWIPSRLGIVAWSTILNRRESIPVTEVTASVVVVRWMELVMQVTAVCGALVLAANPRLPQPVLILIMAVTLGLLVALLAWVVRHRHKVVDTWPARLARLPRLTEEKVIQVLSDLMEGLAEVAQARRLLLGFLWSIIMWSFFFGYYYSMIQAISIDTRPSQMVVIALGALGLAPPSVALKPWAYVALIVAVFSLYGVNTGTITAYALELVVLQAIMVTGLGLWGWRSQNVVTLSEIWPRSKKMVQD